MKKKKRPEKPIIRGAMSLSVEALSLIRESFSLFEETLRRDTSSNPKIPFARDTFVMVRSKVDELLLLQGMGMPVAFDDNEIIIIQACLQMYMIDLLYRKDLPDWEARLKLCRQVEQLLPPMFSPPLRLHD